MASPPSQSSPVTYGGPSTQTWMTRNYSFLDVDVQTEAVTLNMQYEHNAKAGFPTSSITLCIFANINELECTV